MLSGGRRGRAIRHRCSGCDIGLLPGSKVYGVDRDEPGARVSLTGQVTRFTVTRTRYLCYLCARSVP